MLAYRVGQESEADAYKNMETLTPEMLLNAYANGYFPMAESRDADELHWFSPEMRGIIDLDEFHISRSLRQDAKRLIESGTYRITIDTCFRDVITACAQTPRSHQSGSWINHQIIALYTELAAHGFAHSVECWQGDALVGGLYGISLHGAFFGESMFSTADHASKICLIYLVAILREAGYSLLDTQYVNDHLKQFGVREVPKADYETKLSYALNMSDNPSRRFSDIGGSIASASSVPLRDN